MAHDISSFPPHSFAKVPEWCRVDRRNRHRYSDSIAHYRHKTKLAVGISDGIVKTSGI